MEIRKMNVTDVPSVVDINIEMWKKTYSGIMDEEIFIMRDKNKENNIRIMREKICKNDCCYKVAISDNKVIGFIGYGENKDANIEVENLGEVYAIYILEEYHNKGIGKSLIEEAKRDLKKKGYNAVLIWTLKENKNRKFYERLGGKKVLFREVDILGHKFKEVGYMFEKI